MNLFRSEVGYNQSHFLALWTMHMYKLLAVLIVSLLYVFFPIGCFDNRQRSEGTPEESLYLHISEGPAVIYLLEGAEGGRGKGGDKNLPDPPYVSGVFL